MKKLGLLILLILGGMGSIGYSIWSQATKLPDWYSENQTSTRTVTEIQKSGAAIEQKIQQQAIEQKSQPKTVTPVQSPKPINKTVVQKSPQAAPKKQQSDAKSDVKVALNSEELNDLIVTKITEKQASKALPTSVKGFHTSVQDDTLKTGAVIDVSQLKNDDFGAQGREFLTQLTEKLPLGNRKIYIGLEGKPEIKNGRLQFGENTRVRVGDLSLSLKELSDRFGIPPEQLKEKLNLELQLRNLNINSIDFQDGNAILRAAPKDPISP